MKSKVLVLAGILPILAAGLAAGCAHDENAAQSGERYQGAYLTGSNVPQNATRNGPVTNGKDDLRVIDKSEIDRSGGADVGQSLRQLGVH